MERFTVEVVDTGDRTVLVVGGEVDLAAAAALGRVLDRAVGVGAHAVLDCAGITFMDSTGLNLLLHARLKAGQVGAVLGLRAVSDAVARVLELAGVAELFAIEPDPGR